MKKKDVQTGKIYEAKISGNLVPVRLVSESIYGGWNGVNLRTNRDVRIKSAAKLRREMYSNTHGRMS